MTPREPVHPSKITLFHRLAQYTARQGLPVEWDDMAFAFKEDVTGPQAFFSVIWSQDYFHQTNQLRVCTQFADPAIAIVGPFVPADAGTDVRRIHRCAYVPPPVHRFVSGAEPFTPGGGV
jgi:hypothetical protein